MYEVDDLDRDLSVRGALGRTTGVLYLSFGCTFFWLKYFCVTGGAPHPFYRPLYQPFRQPLHCMGGTTRVSHPACVKTKISIHTYTY